MQRQILDVHESLLRETRGGGLGEDGDTRVLEADMWIHGPAAFFG